MFMRSQRMRGARLWLSLAVFGGLAVAGWSAWALASGGKPEKRAWLAQAEVARPQPLVAVSTPEAVPDVLERYQHECQAAVARRHYRQAFKHCGEFTAHPDLAGRAHATLAALYTAPSHYDLERSVTHAHEAVKLSDPRGQFLLASHMLAGRAGVWDMKKVRSLLLGAQQGGVPAASLYLELLDKQQDCRGKARLAPMGLPLFCMFRAEAIGALEAQGMKLRAQDESLWRDEFRPGALLSASTAELTFDMEPADQLFRLARLRYVFSDDVTLARWTALKGSLSSKYGAARIVSAEREAVWTVNDGTEVRLRREASQLLLDYQHPERLRQRELHLNQVQESARHDALMAEAHVL